MTATTITLTTNKKAKINSICPAYPYLDVDACGDPIVQHEGLTKREFVAMQLMSSSSSSMRLAEAAKNAVKAADALLLELER